MNSENLQRAIYTKLTSDAALMALVTGVYAEVQQPEDAADVSDFPYVSIGQDTATPFDAKTFFGSDATVQVDVWSRSNNMSEAKQVGSAITNALHYQPLVIQGASHVMTVQQSEAYTRDPDGHTKRGLLLFQVVFTRN